MAHRAHTVKHGECISSIASSFGFFPETIWDDPENAELKELRKDPDVLQAGDVVHVPELRAREESAPTEKKSSFRRKGVPAKFAMVLLDGDEKRANLPYRLDVDGTLIKGMTDGDGLLEVFIPPNARRGLLIIDHDGEQDVPPEQYAIEFGKLLPVSDDEGVRQRLQNLSYLREGGSSAELDAAVMDFKEDHCGLEIKRDGSATEEDLEEYRKLDQKLRDKLLELHGS